MKQRFYKVKARTLDEAYRSLRARFGEQAVVVSTNEFTEGGLFGILGTKRVELTVAVEEQPAAAPAKRKASAVERRYAEQQQSLNTATSTGTGDLDALRQVVEAAQARMQNSPTTGTAAQASAEQADPLAISPTPAAPPMHSTPKQEAPEAPDTLQGNVAHKPMLQFPEDTAPAPSPENQILHNEIQEIREMMQVLYAEQGAASMPREFAPHYSNLVDRGMSRRSAAALISDIARKGNLDNLKDEEVFAAHLHGALSAKVQATGGLGLQGGACRRVALCGSTGVGKTTNLAKLAARFAVLEHARVALVTADTYRIAASEQLRVYANIIGIPIVVVNTRDEMAHALGEFADFDLVLIDTAGNSQYNLEQINDLRNMLEVAEPDETLLVLSAGTSLNDMHHVVSNYSCLNPTSLMFTKLDETRQYGAMLSLSMETSMPMSYLSVGQNVPEDIRIVSPEFVASLILEGKV